MYTSWQQYYGAIPLLFAPLANSLFTSLFTPFYLLGNPPCCDRIPSTLVPGYSWTDLPFLNPSPFPPHSKFPVPRLIVRPTTTTSWSQLSMSGTGINFYLFSTFLSCFNLKKTNVLAIIICQYLCQWWMAVSVISNSDQCTLADISSGWKTLLGSQRVWNNSGNLAAVDVTLNFFIEGVTYLSTAQLITLALRRSQYHSHSYCQRWNCKTMFFSELIHENYIKKELKMGSGKPKFLRSNTWHPLKPFSVSWHGPFKFFDGNGKMPHCKTMSMLHTLAL
jgi:hypothetical protein